MRALSRGIEGYVIVEYTVTETGTVEDVTVVASEPEGVFDESAVAAAAQFEYRPRIVDGQPVRVPGVRNRFQFTMTQE